MISIGICEDDSKTRKKIENIVMDSYFRYGEIKIFDFQSGEEVIDAVESGQFMVDVLLLDINMGKDSINGMELAAYLRRNKVDVDIIFVTVSKKYVFEGYRYKAYAYCIKPIESSDLSEILERYISEKNDSDDCLNIETKTKNILIQLNRILYLESDRRKVIVHTKNEDFDFYAKLDDVQKKLDTEMFFRCHQSYIVNRKMIESIGRTEINVSGKIVPMSRKYYEMLQTEKIDNQAEIRITRSLAINNSEGGAVVFTEGKLIGLIVRINSGKQIVIGRDAIQSDVVLKAPSISRKHMSVEYNCSDGTYTICDYSKNGVYINKGERIEQGRKYIFKAGEELWIGDEENIIRLG